MRLHHNCAPGWTWFPVPVSQWRKCHKEDSVPPVHMSPYSLGWLVLIHGQCFHTCHEVSSCHSWPHPLAQRICFVEWMFTEVTSVRVATLMSPHVILLPNRHVICYEVWSRHSIAAKIYQVTTSMVLTGWGMMISKCSQYCVRSPSHNWGSLNSTLEKLSFRADLAWSMTRRHVIILKYVDPELW